MIAISKKPHSIHRSLLYNEQKVEEKQAIFLDAYNYLQETQTLSMENKLQRLVSFSDLNERTKAVCAHITLNFHPLDWPTDQLMRDIAGEFMQQIGFGEQPWLLYRHIDAGHPHLHIVSTNIRPDGTRISGDLRSPRHLAQVCAVLEEKYLLVRAAQQQKQTERLTEVKPLIYGENPTKTGIATVLRHVLENYSCTSLEHLNAVLGLYNVRADRGSEEGLMYTHRGLYYRMIDTEGRKVGTPIKASSFDQQPTLSYLEERFVLNQQQQREHLHIRASIVSALHGTLPVSLGQFTAELARHRIGLVIPAITERPVRQKHPNLTAAPALQSQSPQQSPRMPPDDGHGFFYIDITRHTVFRDTELGEYFTAAAVIERLDLKKTIQSLVADLSLQLKSAADRLRLRPGHPDPAETRKALLRLTPQHDALQEAKEAQTQKERQRHRLRLSI